MTDAWIIYIAFQEVKRWTITSEHGNLKHTIIHKTGPRQMNKISFFESEEQAWVDQFLKDGYIITPLENDSLLASIKNKVFGFARNSMELPPEISLDDFFNFTQKFITPNQLNAFRVSVIKQMANDPELRPMVYKLAKKFVHMIVGNELAMQRALNLSIQMPHDTNSLLPMHSDVWSGNSPYEIVFWLPLVNCYNTKSMYILPLEKSNEIFHNMKQFKEMSVSQLYDHIKKDLVWVDVPAGSAVLFAHSILHGNIVNSEDETRWTFNCRFKSLLSPYGTKELGESFLPITMKPITRLGANYYHPALH